MFLAKMSNQSKFRR